MDSGHESRVPVPAHPRVNQLAAGQRRLHQPAHGTGDGKARIGRNGPAAGQGGRPAHRIAGDGDRADPFAIDRKGIAKRRGTDQGAGIVAAGMARQGKAVGTVQRGQGFLPAAARRVPKRAIRAASGECRASVPGSGAVQVPLPGQISTAVVMRKAFARRR